MNCGTGSANVTVSSAEMLALISPEAIWNYDQIARHQLVRYARARWQHTMERMISRTSSVLSIPTSFPMSASPSVRYVAVSFLMSQTGARSIAWLIRPRLHS